MLTARLIALSALFALLTISLAASAPQPAWPVQLSANLTATGIFSFNASSVTNTLRVLFFYDFPAEQQAFWYLSTTGVPFAAEVWLQNQSTISSPKQHPWA